MTHLNEEQLVEHYYSDDASHAESATHLAMCGTCRAEFERLSATLASVSAYEPPARSANYGTAVWNRIRAHLPEQDKRSWWSWAGARRWVAVGAMAALIVTAFLLGRLSKPVPPQNPEVAGKDKDKKVLLVALGDHLDRSQMILVELTHAPQDKDVDISSEQKRAEELLASNRLYRQAAVKSGDADVAAVLDELERLLLEVTHEPSTIDGGQMQDIQRRIESKGILFKVRVIGSKVRSDEAHPDKEPARTAQTTRQTT
jgi:hypothetical protein